MFVSLLHAHTCAGGTRYRAWMMQAELEVSSALFEDLVLQVLAEWLIVGERGCETPSPTCQCPEHG